jgi:cyclin-dependent kinase
MATLFPLFDGESQIDQIRKIFEILGTPNEEDWNGFKNLQYFPKDFCKFKKKSLNSIFKDFLCDEGIDLLSVIDYFLNIL